MKPPKAKSKSISGATTMQKQTVGAALFLGAVFGFGSAEMIHAQVPGYVTKVLMKTDLQNLPGQEAIFYASEWPSGFRLPWHLHQEGHEFVYVIEGEQTFEIEGIGTKVVKAGEVVYTPPNTPHYGRNATDKTSKTLVVRIKAKDQPVMTEVKHD
jgi:quercetin dioxygenase-like cupin family protein